MMDLSDSWEIIEDLRRGPKFQVLTQPYLLVLMTNQAGVVP